MIKSVICATDEDECRQSEKAVSYQPDSGKPLWDNHIDRLTDEACSN